MKRHSFFSLLTLFMLVAGLFSCVQDPEFPLEPRITYRGVEQETKTDPTQGVIESLILIVRFQDGDGNLGLSADRTKFPGDFQGPFADNQTTHHNFFTFVERKVNDKYEPLKVFNNQLTYHGRFPRVSTEERQEPLEGDIRYNINFVKRSTGSVIKNGDIIRFRMYIYDRELNKSNEVTSEDIVIKY
ncbi:MAG: hypothetical protein ACO1OQ_00920 [Rufibacter sp.]